MSARAWWVWSTVVGVTVGVAAAALVVAGWHGGDEPPSTEEATAQFLAAWERSRTATYYVASEFRRTTPAGELEGLHEIAQQPPDLVRRQFGSVTGQLGGHPIVCNQDPQDQVACAQGTTEVRPWEDGVASEMARWEGYFAGSVPLYRVEADGAGCFDLHLTRVFPAPPYGRRARFCFDESTGAPTYTEIRRDEGTDVLEAVEVRARPTAADFALPG